MYIHLGVDRTEKMVHVMYRIDPSMMTGVFQHLPSRDDVRTFAGIDREKQATEFAKGLYAAAFLIREADHNTKLKPNLGTEGNVSP